MPILKVAEIVYHWNMNSKRRRSSSISLTRNNSIGGAVRIIDASIHNDYPKTSTSKEDQYHPLPHQTNESPKVDIAAKLNLTVKSKTDSINARTVLWYLTFFGFAINYMIRINMNITIVDMIVAKRQSPPDEWRLMKDSDVEKIIVVDTKNLSHSGVPFRNDYQAAPFSMERMLLDLLGRSYQTHGFPWNEKQQGALLGSFFWLHWVTQIPGGILARRYGTKLIFGVSNLVGCAMCMVMPIVAFLDFRLLIGLRVIQGLICGLAWPSMHLMTARWIPPNERSKFVTAYLGSSVGVAMFYPLFGLVISCSSWEWVFHVCGVLGILWFFGWQWLVFDSPSMHPRISVEERKYIESALGKTVEEVGGSVAPTPWRSIFLSRPVWVIAIAQFGGVWGLFTLMAQAPTYFRNIHGWNMGMTGLLSGLPHLMRMLFAYVFSVMGDRLLAGDLMSRTNVRKLAGTFSMVVGGFFVVGLAYSGSNSSLAITMLVMATAVHGAVSTGPLASLVDLSPNYSGITLGLTGVFAVLPGFISPYIVGHLTLNNQTAEQWKYVFLITAGMLCSCGLVYLLFSVSELQFWNSPLQKPDIPMVLTSAEQKRLLAEANPEPINSETNENESKALTA